MEEKKMILVTDGYDDKPICVASNTIAARKSALDYLENQYDDGEWEAILEEDGYKNRDDLFHDMMLGMESEWERFNINFAEVLEMRVSKVVREYIEKEVGVKAEIKRQAVHETFSAYETECKIMQEKVKQAVKALNDELLSEVKNKGDEFPQI